MTRTWMLPGFVALLVGLLGPTLARAEDEPKTVEERLAAITKKLDTILTRTSEIQTLRDSVAELRKDLGNLRTEHSLKVQADQATVENLSAKLDALDRKCLRQFEAIDKELGQLRAPAPGSTDVRRAAPEVVAGTGRIRLVNTFNRPVTVRFNGKSYPLQPNDQTALDGQSVGAFTYEVFDDQGASIGRRSSTVTPNQTLTITVHPQP